MIGAGCSVEPPTSLPTSGACAQRAHDLLVLDGVLNHGDCADPKNLEVLADAVDNKEELVNRLPVDAFRNATPNLGHKILAALIGEQVVGNILTTNFDLAITTAISIAGIDHVSTLSGPEDHSKLGNSNLIYLHRHAYSSAKDWVLTSEEVTEGWRDAWEQIMSTLVLSSPFIVFAGMGTLIGVLMTSVEKIRAAIPEGVRIFQVDCAPSAESNVFTTLGIAEDDYIQKGWIDFTVQLGSRVNQSHILDLNQACQTMTTENGWNDQDVLQVTQCFSDAGLWEFGRARATWFMHDGNYCPWRTLQPAWVADLTLGIEMIASELNATVSLTSTGDIEFIDENGHVYSIGCIHGRGIRRWAQLNSLVVERVRTYRQNAVAQTRYLVAGVQGPPIDQLTPPSDIIRERPVSDILVPAVAYSFLDVDRIRDGSVTARDALMP